MTDTAITTWARRWGVSPAALDDLTRALTSPPPPTPPGTTEAAILGAIRLDASKQGWRLFRNNVGACTTSTGSFVRYGLANESKGMNTQLKSSDLVGIRPVTILEEHVGRTIGQFVAIECKRPGWVFRGTPRELAQHRFLTLIESRGGHGRFSTGGLG